MLKHFKTSFKLVVIASLLATANLSHVQFANLANTPTAHAQTVEWTSPRASSYWHLTSMWSTGQAPGPDDDVVIQGNKTVIVNSSTGMSFKSLTLSGGADLVLYGNIVSGGDLTIEDAGTTLTQLNKNQQVLSGTLTIGSGALLTHKENTTSYQYGVNFKAEEIEISGMVEVSEKGYMGGGGTSNTSHTDGYGPGGGGGSTSWSRAPGSGAGHGGKGGDSGRVSSNQANPGGVIYDNKNNPTQPGSGGGGNKLYSKGGAGGGIAILEANNFTLNSSGYIYANGAQGVQGKTVISGTTYYYPGGGGSGGTINLKVKNELTIAGRLVANGGRAGSTANLFPAGGSGGGMVYIAHSADASKVQIRYPSVAEGYGYKMYADPGKIVKEGVYATFPAGITGWTGGPGGNWSDPSNWSTGAVPEERSEVLVNSNGKVTIDSTASFRTLDIEDGAEVIIEGNIDSGGDITVGNTATLTQATTAQQQIAGRLEVVPGGTLTHLPHSGYTHLYSVNFKAKYINIQGDVNVDGKGFKGGQGTRMSGYGPGGAVGNSGIGPGAGAGHGAKGGATSGKSNGGAEYDKEETNPSEPGSGGGANTSSGRYAEGGDGGGVVILEASNTFSVTGDISANGTDGGYKKIAGAGGGSGGTIKLIGKETISLGGDLLAKGGDGGGTGGYYAYCGYTGGAGAGGRIYLGYNMLEQTGTISAAGGKGAGRNPWGCTSTASAPAGSAISEQAFFTIPSHVPEGSLVWVGGREGEWGEASNWAVNGTEESRIPTSSDNVYIANPVTVTLNGTANFETLEVSNLLYTGAAGEEKAILLLYGSISGGDMTIGKGGFVEQMSTALQSLSGTLMIEAEGELTHSDYIGGRLYSVNFTANNIVNSGTIDVSLKGYRGGASNRASGEGAGRATGGTDYGAGAGHGGSGGGGYMSGGKQGHSYGNLQNPQTLGSGGAAGANYSSYGTAMPTSGGDGGGLVLLSATKSITNNGSIITNGGYGRAGVGSGGKGGGGGAGGGINLYAPSIINTGAIRSNGGDARKKDGSIHRGGGGGSGVIYLGYGVLEDTGTIETRGGSGWGHPSAGSAAPLLDQILEDPTINPTEEGLGFKIIGQTPIGNILMGTTQIANTGQIDFDYEDHERCTEFSIFDDEELCAGVAYADKAARLITTSTYDHDGDFLTSEVPATYEWRGWARSDNLGWISFYCGDEGGDENTNMGTPCGDYDYRIEIDAETGEFTEDATSPYAWNIASDYIQLNDTAAAIEYGVLMNPSISTGYVDTDHPDPDQNAGLFVFEEQLHSWGWSDSLGWFEFTGVQALIDDEPIIDPPKVCDEITVADEMYPFCVFMDGFLDGSFGGDEVVADGVDSYTMRIRFNMEGVELHDDGTETVSQFLNQNILGERYNFKITFLWEDTIKRLQTIDLYKYLNQTTQYQGDPSSAIPIADEELPGLNTPFDSGTDGAYDRSAGGVYYKPVVLRTYGSDGIFESDIGESINDNEIEDSSKENILGTNHDGIWEINDVEMCSNGTYNLSKCEQIVTKPMLEYVIDVTSLAPSDSLNYSETTGEDDGNQIQNMDFNEVSVPFERVKYDFEENKLILNQIKWEFLDNSPNTSHVGGELYADEGYFYVAGSGSHPIELAFKPAIEVSQLDVAGADLEDDPFDSDSLVAYRGIPISFETGLHNNSNNNNSLVPMNDPTVDVKYNMFYRPSKDEAGIYEGFNFWPLEEYIEDQLANAAAAAAAAADENTVTVTEPGGVTGVVEVVEEGDVTEGEEGQEEEEKDFWAESEEYSKEVREKELHFSLITKLDDLQEFSPFEGIFFTDRGNTPGEASRSGSVYTEIELRSTQYDQKPIQYYSNHLPRNPGMFSNPVAKILGNIYAQIAYSPNKNRVTTAVGDPAVNIVRDTVYKNIQKTIRSVSLPAKQDSVTIDNLNGGCSSILGCYSITIGGPDNANYYEELWFVNAKEVILEGETLTWDREGMYKQNPEKEKVNITIVVNGGNLKINSNLYNGHYNNGLGIVVLRDLTQEKPLETGHVYIDAAVQNLQAVTIVADGSLFSYDKTKTTIDLDTGEPVWASETERTQALSKQLMIEGAISTRNTIGGAEPKQFEDNGPEEYIIGTGLRLETSDDNRQRAQQYDLNFLRFFRLKVNRHADGKIEDQSCKVFLDTTEMAEIATAIQEVGSVTQYVTSPPTDAIKNQDGEVCDGIDYSRSYDPEASISGDLVPGEAELAQGGESAQENPVFIKYVRPNPRSFIFSTEKILTY